MFVYTCENLRADIRLDLNSLQIFKVSEIYIRIGNKSGRSIYLKHSSIAVYFISIQKCTLENITMTWICYETKNQITRKAI